MLAESGMQVLILLSEALQVIAIPQFECCGGLTQVLLFPLHVLVYRHTGEELVIGSWLLGVSNVIPGYAADRLSVANTFTLREYIKLRGR